MTKILLALAVASLVTACDGQWTEWTWGPCRCGDNPFGYQIRSRESSTEPAEIEYGFCTEPMCALEAAKKQRRDVPCPVTPECTADGCVMAVHDECLVLNVLNMTTGNADTAKRACVAEYGYAAQLPEAATQADLDAIFALSQTYHAKNVWMSATSETVDGSWSWESGTDVEADLWKPSYPKKSDSTSNLCSIVHKKRNTITMVNRPCERSRTRSVVCATPTSDSGDDTKTIPLSFTLGIDVAGRNVNEDREDYETLKTEIETQLETEIASVTTGVRVIVTGMEIMGQSDDQYLKVNIGMVVPSDIGEEDKWSALEKLNYSATITVDGNTAPLGDFTIEMDEDSFNT